MFTSETYIKRRTAFRQSLYDRGILNGTLLLLANSECPRNYPSNCYPFRQDSTWKYLVGLDVPGIAFTLDIDSGHSCIYADDPDIDSIIWTGGMPTRSQLAGLTACDEAASFSALSALLAREHAAKKPVFIFPPYRAEQVSALVALLGLPDASPADFLKEHINTSVIAALVSLREIKEPEEIAEIERAVTITKAIHEDILHNFRAGWTEKQAANRVLSLASEYGCELAFATIATCKGAVLHNAPTAYAATSNDTFLLDAGVEMPSGYAGDLTTTFPVGERFDVQSREIYEVLSRVFNEAISVLGPGVRFIDVHKRASVALAQGLTSLGIMKGDPEKAVQAGAHALFFPHGLGHQIGLDVHDMEGLGEDIVGYGDELGRSDQFGLHALRLAKTLKPGMVHSVEPGIYFISELIERWRAQGICKDYIEYDNINKWMHVGGMRIEEDWCITESGARRLGPEFDKKVAAIEAARSGK
jgi:Xaa-Pro aminopeptidase